MGIIVEKPEEWIGYEVELDCGEITRESIQKYALAIGDYNPLYFDDDYARKYGYEGIIGSPNFLSCIVEWQPAQHMEDLYEDGSDSGVFSKHMVPMTEGSRRLGGGQELEFFKPVRPGDTIKCKRKILDIHEKKSSKGWMCFITIESDFIDQHDEIVTILKDTFLAIQW